MDDRELLEQYVRHGSHEAFKCLVERHIGRVYAAARRQVGNGSLAEDVTQAVFIVLARRGWTIQPGISLCGWLLKATSYAAKDALKRERRRKHHEQKAAEQAAMIEHGPDEASEHPQAWLLDEALAALSDQDRSVVALRYVEGQSVQEVAKTLGISEEAAGKRAQRAVERLRTYFQRNGAAVASAAVVAKLEASAQAAVPEGLAAAVSHGALQAGSGSAALCIATSVISTMQIAKIKAIVTPLAVALCLSGAAVVAGHKLIQWRAMPTVVPPPQVFVREVQRYLGHTDVVWGLACSADGRRMVSVSDDGMVVFWDLVGGRVLWSRDYPGPERKVHCVALAPDGASILAGKYGGSLILIEAQSSSEIRRFVGHNDNVVAVAFSPDGRQAFSVGGNRMFQMNRDTSLRFWEVASGREIHPPVRANLPLFALAVSPDGRTLACGGGDRLISIVDVATGQVKATLPGHAATIQHLEFSPNSKALLSGADDGTLYLWDLARGSVVRSFEGHAERVHHLRFTADGRTFLSSSLDGTIRLWETASGRTLCLFDSRSGGCMPAIFTPDEQSILAGYGDGLIRRWRVPALK